MIYGRICLAKHKDAIKNECLVLYASDRLTTPSHEYSTVKTEKRRMPAKGREDDTGRQSGNGIGG